MNATLTPHNEGLRLYAYDDHDGKAIEPGSTIVGTVTFGYGIAISKPYGGIELDEADFLVLYRLFKLHRALAGRFSNWNDLSETRRAVLADIAFNRGLGHLDEMNLKPLIEADQFLLAGKAISDCPAAKEDTARYALLAQLMVDDPSTMPFTVAYTPTLSADIYEFIDRS